MDLVGPDFQSVLDVSSLLKLNSVGDHMKDNKEGKSQGYKIYDTRVSWMKPWGNVIFALY